MFAAGDDLDDLMILCRADITTKSPNRVKQYLKNFKKVEEKMSNVTERDAMKAFQSPVRGAEIKEAIEEAILDGKIDNSYDAAKDYLLEIKDRILQ